MMEYLDEEYREQARADVCAALRRLSDDELHRGVRAFAHPPRGQSAPTLGDCAGCFCYEAFGTARGELYWRNGDPHRTTLSSAYESHTDFLYGECVRELAERGIMIEPAPVKMALA